MSQFAHPLGCVLWFNFATLEGTRVYDQSGQDNHGTLYGPAWKRGPIGGMLSFDGVDDRVNIPSTIPMDVFNTGNYAIEALIRYEIALRNDWHPLIVCRQADVTGQALLLGARWGNDYPRTFIIDQYGIALSAYFVFYPKFYHLVASNDAGTLTLYIDGESVASGSFPAHVYTTNPTIVLAYGWYQSKVDFALLRIYNRALSVDEIKAHYYYYLTRLKEG